MRVSASASKNVRSIDTGVMTQTWNPEIPNQWVRQKADPGRQGKTTGKVRQTTNQTQVEVQFRLNQIQFIYYDELELRPLDETVDDLFAGRRFGYPVNLRQLLMFEKLQRKLLNPFYDVDYRSFPTSKNSLQLQFEVINSSIGRFLISNNATIDAKLAAFYVFKRLQTQEEIRHILIISSSQANKKEWERIFNDMLQGIAPNAENKSNQSSQVHILSSVKELITNSQTLKPYLAFTKKQTPSLSIQILGLRKATKDWQDKESESEMTQFTRFLDSNIATPESSLFDLVIIDKAKDYSENDSSYHQIGKLLRRNTSHLCLLTDQPIQVTDPKFRHLLNLFDNSLSVPSLFPELYPGKNTSSKSSKSPDVSILVFSDTALRQGCFLQQASNESIDELQEFVYDFFDAHCRGFQISVVSEAVIKIDLPPEVRSEIRTFVELPGQNPTELLQGITALQRTSVLGLFDPKRVSQMDKGYELLEPSHPLLKWIQKQYQCGEPALHRVSACRLQHETAKVPIGIYFYAVICSNCVELQTQHQFTYRLVEISQNKYLPEQQAKEVINQAGLKGEYLPNVAGTLQCHQLEYEKIQRILEQEQRLLHNADMERTEANLASARLKVAEAQRQRVLERAEHQCQEIERQNQEWLKQQVNLTKIVLGTQAIPNAELEELESVLKRLESSQKKSIRQKAAQTCAEIKSQVEIFTSEKKMIAAGIISVVN